jgi:hypothetical protein
MLSYLLAVAAAGRVVGLGSVAGILCMLALAFFDKLLGLRKVVAVVVALTLWSMVDVSVPWGIQLTQSAIQTLLAPPPRIEFALCATVAMLLLTFSFVGLLIVNFSELILIKYLIKRWKLKERCGNIYV